MEGKQQLNRGERRRILRVMADNRIGIYDTEFCNKQDGSTYIFTIAVVDLSHDRVHLYLNPIWHQQSDAKIYKKMQQRMDFLRTKTDSIKDIKISSEQIKELEQLGFFITVYTKLEEFLDTIDSKFNFLFTYNGDQDYLILERQLKYNSMVQNRIQAKMQDIGTYNHYVPRNFTGLTIDLKGNPKNVHDGLSDVLVMREEFLIKFSQLIDE